MKNYNFISPSIDGVLSDDGLYFEGVNRPMEIYILRDGGKIDQKNIEILEKYFNDVYNLFLRKISYFASFESLNDEEDTKLQALLQELIKVKRLVFGISEEKKE